MKRFLPAYASLIYAFLYLPLFTLGVFSFNNSKMAVWSGFTTDWYRRLWSDSVLLEGTINSLLIAIVASGIATGAGTLAGYGAWLLVSIQKLCPWLCTQWPARESTRK